MIKAVKKEISENSYIAIQGARDQGKNLQNAATFKTQFCAEELNNDNFTNR